MIKTLSRYQPAKLPPTDPSAAVMVILLIDDNDHIEILLTKRAATLPTYAGDYSFPGGIKDETDIDLYATAVRELNEELAIPLGTYEKIAELDDFEDRFGHVVRPFVIRMPKVNFEKLYHFSSDEIEAIYYLPWEKLKELKDAPDLHAITRRRPSYAFKEEDVFIWGLTAGILVHVWNIVEDEKKEVGRKIVKD